MRSIAALIRRRPLVAYYVLTFGISWLVWSPMVIKPENTAIVTPVTMVGAFGPLLAALIGIRTREGRAGVRAWRAAIFRWRVPVAYYAATLLLPFALVFLGYGLFQLLGGAAPEGWTPPPWFTYPILFLLVFFLGGGQEEPGWRGFALLRLEARFSPLVASLILGVLWAFWHLPLFFVPASSQSAAGFPFGAYLVGTTALAVIFTWQFHRTQGSVLLAMALHAGLNAALNWVPILGTGGPVSLFVCIVAVECLVAGALIVVGRLWTRAADQPAPQG